MRKTLTLFVAILSVLLILPVSASEPDNKGTDVLYQVTSNYAWQIHGQIDFGQDKGAAGETVQAQINSENVGVKVTQNRIAEGQSLRITINTANGFKVKSGTIERSYQVLKGASPLAANDTVLELAAGVNTGDQPLSFVLAGQEAEVAGNYSDRVTYTATIVD